MKPTQQCPCCGSDSFQEWAKATDREYRTTDETFTLYRCKNCESLYLHPVPIDRLSIIYPSNYYSFAEQNTSIISSIKTGLDKRFFRQLSQSVKKQSLTALDVGGGVGWELNVLQEADNRVKNTMIVDLDPDAAAGAAKNGHGYFCGRIEEYETTTKYDIILMLNLIEHVEFPREVLKKCRELLSDEGIIIIKTPNCDALDARIFRNRNWGGFHCPRHWTLFTKSSFELCAKNAGLSVKTFSYTQGAPFWATSTLFALENMGMVKITKERPVVYHPLYAPLTGIFAGFDFIRGIFAKTSQMFFVLEKGKQI